LLFNCGTTVVPPEPEGVLLLYFDDPSALFNEADDPGVAVLFDEPDVESAVASLELCFDAKGFKLLNQPACAGETTMTIAAKMRESIPIAFTDPNSLQCCEGNRTCRRKTSVAANPRHG
jgi:hypothetical protein